MGYQPLDSNRHEIRLLTISEVPSATITCTLSIVSLLNQPSYTALSYHWGVEKASQKIILDGKEMEITVNLDHVLRQLRQENHGPLWIDALCINQNDTTEKSKQILLMKNIYSQAAEVIAWLGPAGRRSDEAMLLMNACRKFAPTSERIPGIGSGPILSEDCFADDIEAWAAIDDLLGRPYWQRTWILQELALANTVVFRCGAKSAPFEDLRGLFSVIGRWANSLDVQNLTLKRAHLRSISIILGLRDPDGMNKDGIPLASILAESEHQQVTDLRDKVYGLLSMASDASTLVPLPSYDIPASEVYINLTRSLIVNSKRLDYIRFKSPFGKSSLDIPSWVMDFSTPCFDASTIMSQDRLHAPIDCKSEPEANVTFSDAYYGQQTLLGSWGIVIGTVDGIGSVLPIQSAFSDPEYCIIQPNSKANRYHSEDATLDAIVGALLGWRCVSDLSLEDSYQMECSKFSVKALMKQENHTLLASLPEFSEWLDKNKELAFGDRSLARWSTLATENVPNWKGSRLREMLMMPRPRRAINHRNQDQTIPEDISTLEDDQTSTELTNEVPTAEKTQEDAVQDYSTPMTKPSDGRKPRVFPIHERKVDSDATSLGHGTKESSEATQLDKDANDPFIDGDTPLAQQSLATARVNEMKYDDQAESTEQIPIIKIIRPGGVEADERTPNSGDPPDGLMAKPEIHRSANKVFNRMIRVRRNSRTWLESRFSVAAALSSGSNNFSLTEIELEKIELTVKSMLEILARYRRIITTSNGYIGSAHPQVRKGDKICFFPGGGESYVILREGDPSPEKLTKIDTERDPAGDIHAMTLYRVIGEASIAGLQRFESPEFKWELFGLQ